MKPKSIWTLCFLFFCSSSALAASNPVLPGLHPDGPVGVWRTFSAQRREAGPTAIGLSLSSRYFNLSDFPVSGTDLERLSGKAAISYTPLSSWEIFLSGSAWTSNEDVTAALVQQVGNMDFGTKIAFDVDEIWSVGVMGLGHYRRGAVDLGYTDTALSWDALALGTLDLWSQGIPLRIHGNVGFRLDQTGHLLPNTALEAARILYGVNGEHSLLAGLGVEVPLRPVVLSAEYTMEIALDAAGVGVFDNPQRATLGVRYFPSEDRTWGVGLASDLGFFASDGASRIVKEPDFGFHAGLFFHFAKPGSRVEALPTKVAEVENENYIFGKVTNARTGHSVGGAIIALCGPEISPLVSNPEDGRFRSYPLPAGDCNLTVTADGYSPLSQMVRVPDQGNLQHDMVLTPSEPERGIVVVRVKDGKGKPTQAQIVLPDVPRAKPMETDSEGRLRIKLPVNTYVMRAEGPKGSFSTVNVDVVDGTEVYAEFLLQSGATEAFLDDGLISVVKPIQFKSGSEVISQESEKTLQDVAKILQANPQIELVEIGGHTDSSGSSEKNLQLSQMRADAVMETLISLGIQKSRLTPVGYGSDQPIADNATLAGRKANRRVEFKILK